MWHEQIPMAIWEAVGFTIKAFGLISAIICFVIFLFKEEKEDRGVEHNPITPKEKISTKIKNVYHKIKNKITEYRK